MANRTLTPALSRRAGRGSTTRRSARAGLLVLLPLFLAGCLDYGEELTIEKDGTGTLKLDFVVDMAYMAEVSRALGDQPSPEEMRGPTKEEIQQGLVVEGITVRELEVQERESRTRVHLLLHFTSLEALGKIEGFGDDRKIEFFDEGEGKVRVVYSFDTTDIVPIEETPEAGAEQDPVEKKILEVTRRARDAIRFRARVKLPGAIVRSNGARDPADPNVAVWRVDKQSDPERHVRLGRGKVIMMLLVDRASLPVVTDL
jgi:hypothetical protein